MKQSQNDTPSVLYKMSRIQEIGNAVSMILPTIVVITNLYYNYNYKLIILLLCCLIHFQISFIYHINSAFDRYTDRLDNNMRRLDQTMQHIICIISSYLLSDSINYMIFNLIINIYYIYYIWDKETSNDGKRWINIYLSILLYIIPLLWKKDYINFLIAFISIDICGILFVPEINTKIFLGWGHTVFHIILIFHVQALINSLSR